MKPSSTRSVKGPPLGLLLQIASLPLFLGALLADWAYFTTAEIQWINFAAWLSPSALLLSGPALISLALGLFRGGAWHDRVALGGVILLALTFLLGLVNALIHAKDAWATMPGGLVLSVLVFVLAVAAAWMSGAGLRPRLVRP